MLGDVTYCVCCAKKSSNLHSLIFLRRHFDVHSNSKTFSLMSHSEGLGRYEKKLDTSSQSIRLLI